MLKTRSKVQGRMSCFLWKRVVNSKPRCFATFCENIIVVTNNKHCPVALLLVRRTINNKRHSIQDNSRIIIKPIKNNYSLNRQKQLALNIPLKPMYMLQRQLLEKTSRYYSSYKTTPSYTQFSSVWGVRMPHSIRDKLIHCQATRRQK